MSEKMYTVSKASSSEEGATVSRDGEVILRTLIGTDEVDRHDKLAAIIADLMNRYEEAGNDASRINARSKPSSTSPKPDNRGDIDYEWVRNTLKAANERGLNEGFEEDFVISLEEKLGQYGDKTFISLKQMAVLERMEETNEGDD